MNLASSTVGLLASIHHLILLNEFVDSKYRRMLLFGIGLVIWIA